MKTTKILIADDHHLIAESLSMLLGNVDDFEVLGNVSNGWQALSFAEKETVDIVLTDYHMPLLNGVETAMRMQEASPQTKCIILTMSEEAHHIKEALNANVYGYVMKSAEKAELITAIRIVANGEKYFSAKIIKKLAEIPNSDNPTGKTRIDDAVSLTKRELQILKLIVDDHSNHEIGDQLEISSLTVETHRRNLMKKLGVNSAIGLLRWGMKHGVIDK